MYGGYSMPWKQPTEITYLVLYVWFKFLCFHIVPHNSTHDKYHQILFLWQEIRLSVSGMIHRETQTHSDVWNSFRCVPDSLNPAETCLNTSHSPSIALYYASCNILRQLPYFTSWPCQHWCNRTGKTHHSTMIFKYQTVFHLGKIIRLPNKTNANIVN